MSERTFWYVHGFSMRKMAQGLSFGKTFMGKIILKLNVTLPNFEQCQSEFRVFQHFMTKKREKTISVGIQEGISQINFIPAYHFKPGVGFIKFRTQISDSDSKSEKSR